MFEWKSIENGSNVSLEMNAHNFEDLIDVPQTKQIQKPPAQVQAPTIIEVNDEEIIEWGMKIRSDEEIQKIISPELYYEDSGNDDFDAF